MAIVISPEVEQQLLEQFREVLNRLPTHIKDIEEAETLLEKGLGELGQKTMQAWVQSAATECSAPRCSECGVTMRHRGIVSRTLVTIHGDVKYRYARRRCDRCGRENCEQAEAVRFGPHSVTWEVARRACRLASLLRSYEMTQQLLMKDYGISLSKHTIEQLVTTAGGMLLEGDDAARAACFADAGHGRARGPKESPIAPELVTVYADGTMIHTQGDWREIRVGRVIAEGKQQERLRQRTFARLMQVEEFGQALYVAAHAAGYGKAKRRAFVADGARWLWELAALHFPEATLVLDWYHLSQNVHSAAEVVFGEGTEEGKKWAQERLSELWEGKHRLAREQVVALQRQRRGVKREALRKLSVYLRNNAERMDYPRYRREGLPIASGPVESMCKTLVGARCKQAGMRNWTARGAQAVLRLRAALLDDDYEPLWDARLKQAA